MRELNRDSSASDFGAKPRGRTTRSGGRCGTPERRSPPGGRGRGRRGGGRRGAPTDPAGRRPAFPRRGTACRRAARGPGRESSAAALPGERRRQALLEPEHLRARAERPAERGDHGRALEPAAARRCREDVPEPVRDVEVHGSPALGSPRPTVATARGCWEPSESGSVVLGRPRRPARGARPSTPPRGGCRGGPRRRRRARPGQRTRALRTR